MKRDITLTWDQYHGKDAVALRLYCDGRRIGTLPLDTVSITITRPDWENTHHYHLVSFDKHDNESEASEVVTVDKLSCLPKPTSFKEEAC